MISKPVENCFFVESKAFTKGQKIEEMKKEKRKRTRRSQENRNRRQERKR